MTSADAELHNLQEARSEWAGDGMSLRSHQLAEIFPLLEGPQLDDLVDDIRSNGLREPVVLLDGQILDGRNRYRAYLRAGVDPTFVPYRGADPAAYVISANIRRRHLTAKQKRDLIAKLIKAQPEKSNRQIAKATGTSHTHINKVRAEMEEAGDVEIVSTSIDTKGRKQPAKKAKAERNRKAHERRAAKKAQEEAAFQAAEKEAAEAANARAEHLAADLIKADLARRVLSYLTWEEDPRCLQDALKRLLDNKHNSADATSSAEDMKARFAALESNDTGPIPESLRRQPAGAA